jgi:hypothetical protein
MAASLVGDIHTFRARGAVAPVQVRPFQGNHAEVQSRPTTGELLWCHGTIYRDTAGRVRQKHIVEDETQRPASVHTVESTVDPSVMVAQFAGSAIPDSVNVEVGQRCCPMFHALSCHGLLQFLQPADGCADLLPPVGLG